MPKIKNAIIMAAGFGTRMRPLTYHTPKPLIRVNGKPMIESVIEGLHQNQINDISIVTGYLGEQFNYLQSKYPGVKLISNPYYDRYNNISSLYVARNELEDTVILDGDQVIVNPQILSPYFECSGYAGTKIDTWSDEWIMHVDDENTITSCDRDGSDHGWRLYSLSKWTAADSAKLKELLVQEFEVMNHRDIYWDDVAMFKHFDDFRLKLLPIKSGDIIEIDSVDQLKQVNSRVEG
ncbi:NTP transferase domain-containing protein [Limosilactobacillus pontis]|uniref:NTP transferase domain-containing protein n=1 Tax=Limosilactobacillus pontis TaxID=35787 RepID=A0ABU7SV04_9LACO